jgi:hypothetical protein
MKMKVKWSRVLRRWFICCPFDSHFHCRVLAVSLFVSLSRAMDSASNHSRLQHSNEQERYVRAV